MTVQQEMEQIRLRAQKWMDGLTVRNGARFKVEPDDDSCDAWVKAVRIAVNSLVIEADDVTCAREQDAISEARSIMKAHGVWIGVLRSSNGEE